TAKLRVSAGNPDQLSWGLRSLPPAPMIPLICPLASGCPLVIDAEVSRNEGSFGSSAEGLGRVIGGWAAEGSGGVLIVAPLVRSACFPGSSLSTVCQEVFQHFRAELQCVDRNPLVHAVEQRGEIEVRRQPERDEAEAANTQAGKRFRIGPTG